MVKRFEQLTEKLVDNNVVVWFTVLFVMTMSIFENAEPVKFIKFCVTLAFMYAALSYMEIKRLRKLISDRRQGGR